ncbi:hypothetical protein [Aliiruegeria lutimaris]|uniref:Uncharacterized protein n=1 Tax=Aliiruegeria lutimaris TaxID=571298 RepID=A0A1G8UZ55_9RHOB|nr:hypothetical protein [Aliiruegeria lutimaris]SDJ58230.1 hypothetical protein SAMN04488026_102011 [Aliiruegeria lutimaris]
MAELDPETLERLRKTKPWNPDTATPLDWAKRFWHDPTGIDLEFACQLAEHDPKVWEQVWEWAKNEPDLPDAAKVRLFDLLVVQGKPGAGPGRQREVLRNLLLRRIADWLVDNCGLTLTCNAAGGVSAASILAELEGTPGERAIEKVLLAKEQR